MPAIGHANKCIYNCMDKEAIISFFKIAKFSAKLYCDSKYIMNLC